MGKNPAASAEVGLIPGFGKLSVEEEMATYSSILAWRIPRTEEPGGLESMGSQRIGHNRETERQCGVKDAWQRDLSARGDHRRKGTGSGSFGTAGLDG